MEDADRERRIEMLTDVIAENTAAIREHLELQRRDGATHRAELAEHRAELAEHRNELVALRRTSDMQTEELRLARERSDRRFELTHAQAEAQTRLLERLVGRLGDPPAG